MFSACGDRSENTVVGYFTDNTDNRVYVVDIDAMKVLKNLPTGHADTHTPDVVYSKDGRTKLYISNRQESYIDVVDSESNTITKTISLQFSPRSMNTNTRTHLTEVASTDKSVAAVIDAKTDTVLATVGDLNLQISDKCGHPYWLDDTHFVFIDRENKKIHTFKIEKNGTNWDTQELNVLNTQAPVHQILTPNVNGKRNYDATTFYAMVEGDSTHFPAVLKLDFDKQTGMHTVETLELNTTGNTTDETGGHHLDFLKDGKTLYAGSKEGHLYVVDYSTTPMYIVKTIDVGKGAGHTAVMKHQNIAVIINHSDKFISLINTTTHTKIKDITVSQLPDSDVGNVQIQAHTQYHFSDDEKYFYMALTEEGELIGVNLNTDVVKRVVLGGTVTMSAFIEVPQ